MSMSNFPLDWSGTYEYDYSPSLDSTPEPVTFQLEIQFSNDTEFTGTVCDDPDSNMPEPGVVTGKLIGNRIEFVKQMPKATYIEPSGDSLKFDCAHPPIYYTGEYIPDEALLIGGWHFAPISTGVLEWPATGGTWHADAKPTEQFRVPDRK